jgi:translation elongation factor EF-Tu-like GTPase
LLGSNVSIEIPSITAEVTFLTKAEGGRNNPPSNGSVYRPHLVVGNPNQREALYEPNTRIGIEEYLGVSFTGQGEQLAFNTSHKVSLRLMYFPEVDYAKLVTGATFTVREGGAIVGYGHVISGVAT